jgi:hypothetical protein
MKGKNAIVLFLLFFLAFLLRATGAKFGLPHTLHFDEKGVVTEALRFGKNLNIGFYVKSPPNMLYNFGIYSLYYIYGKARGKFGSVKDFQKNFILEPENFYILGRIGTALLFSLGIFPLFFLARMTLKNESLAFLTTAFYAVSPLDVRSAHVMKEDGMAIFLLIIALFFLHRFFENPDRKNFLLLAFFSALSVNGKTYNTLLLVPVIAGFLLKKQGIKKFILFVFLFYFFQILTNPYILISFEKNWISIPGASTVFIYLFKIFPSLSERWASLWMVRFTGVGMVGKAQGPVAFFNSLYSYGGGFFILLIILTLIFSFIFVKKKKWILMPLSFVIFHLILLCTYTQTGARYFLPSIPYISLLFGFIFSRWEKGKIAGFVLLIPIFITSLITVYHYVEGKTTVELMVKYIRENIPSGSRLLVEEISFPSLPMNRESIEREFLEYKEIFPEIEGTTYKIRMEVAEDGYSVRLLRWSYAYSYLAKSIEEKKKFLPALEEVMNSEDYVLFTGLLVQNFLRNKDERAKPMADFLSSIGRELKLEKRICADGKRIFGWCTYLFSTKRDEVSHDKLNEIFAEEGDDIAHY